MSNTAVALGEVLWDLLPDGPQLGGAPGNFIWRMHELGHPAALISRIGRDELGRRARQILAASGMDISALQEDSVLPTGTVQVCLDAKGSPDFLIVPNVAYDALEVSTAALDVVRSAQCVCFGTLVQRSPQTRATLYALLAETSGALKFLDINLRKLCYTPETIRESLKRADILKLNETEWPIVGEALGIASGDPREFAAQLFQALPLKLILVTLGERGALAFKPNAAPAHVAGHRVEVVDTCGSGDAFSAGFLHQYLVGAPLLQCLEFGNALGAMVAEQSGATQPINQARLEVLLKATRAPG